MPTMTSVKHDQLQTSTKAWPPHAPQQLEPTPELMAELAAASARLESASPEEIISWAHDRFAPLPHDGHRVWPRGVCDSVDARQGSAGDLCL